MMAWLAAWGMVLMAAARTKITGTVLGAHYSVPVLGLAGLVAVLALAAGILLLARLMLADSRRARTATA